MSTITAILEADADGTLHLPLPVGLRRGKVRVTATLQPVVSAQAQMTLERDKPPPVPGSIKGFWMSPDFDEPLEDFREYME